MCFAYVKNGQSRRLKTFNSRWNIAAYFWNPCRWYRPLIGADDTGRCTLIIWPIFGTRLVSFTYLHLSDVTLLFEQWIILKNLHFILLFLNIWTLTFDCLRLLKTRFTYFWAFVSRTIAGLFKVYFDFQNVHLTTRHGDHTVISHFV